ncbi:MAG: hypothetical protein ACREJN_02490, partial [Nitrospiraceae bacterium]
LALFNKSTNGLGWLARGRLDQTMDDVVASDSPGFDPRTQICSGVVVWQDACKPTPVLDEFSKVRAHLDPASGLDPLDERKKPVSDNALLQSDRLEVEAISDSPVDSSPRLEVTEVLRPVAGHLISFAVRSNAGGEPRPKARAQRKL